MPSEYIIPQIEGFRLDSSGFSPAFYPVGPNPLVSEIEVRQIADITLQTKQTSRICLHRSPDDTLHFMVIAQYRGFDPNQPLARVHPMKEKIFQPLLGRLLIICISAFGKIVSENILNPTKGDIQSISQGQNYLDLPVDEVTVHAEIVIGPFNSSVDRVFPTMPWDVSIDEKKNFYDTCIQRAEKSKRVV